MKLKFKDRKYNLFLEENLSQGSYDFLQSIKTNLYKTLDFDFMNNFKVVNGDTSYKRLMKKSSLATSNIEKEYDLSTISFTKEEDYILDISKRRKSYWTFEKFLSKNELFKLLKLSYFNKNDNSTGRNIASGGATYPIEIYFLNQNISDLEKGVFYYNVNTEKLQLISLMKDHDVNEFVKHAFLTDKKSDIDYFNSSGIIFFSGILSRSILKYKDLGIKLAFIETGSILQSFYMNCSLMSFKCCACNGFIDSNIEKIIKGKSDLDHIVTTLFIGK